MDAATAAVEAVERLVSGFEELPVEPVAADTASAFALLAVLQAEKGDADAAFTTLERRRAHALRIALASNELDIHRGMTDAERDEERRRKVDVTSIAAQIRNETGMPRPDKARIARLEERLATAKAARTTARQQLFSRLPGLRAWRGLAGPADSAEALSSLGSPVPLLAEFVVTDDDLLAVIVREDGGKLETRALVAAVESRVLTQRITQGTRSGGAAERRDMARCRSRDCETLSSRGLDRDCERAPCADCARRRVVACALRSVAVRRGRVWAIGPTRYVVCDRSCRRPRILPRAAERVPCSRWLLRN